MRKTFTDSLVCKRTDPQTLHRLVASCFLHHPALYHLSLLAGVTTVYYLVATSDKHRDSLHLTLYARLVDDLDAELGWNHRQYGKHP